MRFLVLWASEAVFLQRLTGYARPVLQIITGMHAVYTVDTYMLFLSYLTCRIFLSPLVICFPFASEVARKFDLATVVDSAKPFRIEEEATGKIRKRLVIIKVFSL